MERTHIPIVNIPKKKKAKNPIRKVAPKRAKVNRVYMQLREEFLQANPYCQYVMNERFATIDHRLLVDQLKSQLPSSAQIHHKKGRGKFMLDTSTWLAVSEVGHIQIHADPKTSYFKGYMLPRR